MRLETTVPVSYECPKCGAELEAEPRAWNGWLRCPACGRASLPPEPAWLPDDSQPGTVAATENGVPEVAHTLGQDSPLEPPGPAATRMAHTSVARLIFTTGLVLCLLLTLIYFIDGKPMLLGIFGFLSMFFFALLLRTPRKRVLLPRPRWDRPATDAEATDHTVG